MSRKSRLEAALAKNQVPGNGVVVSTAKDIKKVKLRAMIYPNGGSQPYEEDIQVGDDGTFTVKGSSLTFHVSKGSVVRCLDGLMRVIVHEGQGQTVNVASLTGENVMHPMTLNAIAENNYWKQWSDFLGRRAFWRQAGTWGMILIGVGVLLVLAWQVKTLGNGFEDLAHAWQNLHTGTDPTTAAEAAGHNNIAPSGP